MAIFGSLCISYILLLGFPLLVRGGNTSRCGSCSPGIPDTPGIPGTPGLPGSPCSSDTPGPRGPKGEPGLNNRGTWKQCAWSHVNNGLDNGLMHACAFTKKRSDTALKVFYQGNLRVHGKDGCCKRWFFTFDNRECSGPLPIDSIIYQSMGSLNIHRPTTVLGYCSGIARGSITVGFHVGNCKLNVPCDAYTSYNAISRIIIEEVEPGQ